MFAGGMSPSDCMRILPDVERWSWLNTRMDVQHFEAPGARPGRFTAETRMLETGDAPADMIARIDTEHVTVLSSTNADAHGMRLETTGDGGADTVAISGGTVLFHEAAEIFDVMMGPADEGSKLALVGGIMEERVARAHTLPAGPHDLLQWNDV